MCDHLALMLDESKLSLNQTITPIDGSGYRDISAEVLDTWQFRWWILGEGDRIEVIAPEQLRQEIQEMLYRTLCQYQINP